MGRVFLIAVLLFSVILPGCGAGGGGGSTSGSSPLIPATGKLEGAIVQGSQPVSGADVSVSSPLGRAVDTSSGGGRAIRGRTDSNGYFLLTDLDQGLYTLTVTSGQISYTTRVRIQGGVTNYVGNDAQNKYLDLSRGSVTGRVLSKNGTPIGGYVVVADDSASLMTTTWSDGTFTFYNLSPGNHSLRSFWSRKEGENGGSSLSKSFAVEAGKLAETDLTIEVSGASIVGAIKWNGAPLSGVTLEYATPNGVIAASVVTDSSGNYKIPDLPDGTYTFTPKHPNYQFNPASTTVTIANFLSLLKIQPSFYTISGTVTLSGSPLSGITVNLTGDNVSQTSTDASGNYSFTGLPNGTYTVTPQHPNFTFTPVNSNVTIMNASQVGINFTATRVAYGWSGTITNKSGGAPLAGVTVDLWNPDQTGTLIATTSTDSNGFYQFNGLTNGNTYTVEPSLTDWGFTPPDKTAQINSADLTGQNFQGSYLSYAITGTIKDSFDNRPVEGLTVNLTGAAVASVATDGQGKYTFSDLSAGVYTVTPSQANYTFTPVSASITITNKNKSKNFTADYTLLSVSGQVKNQSGVKLSGVTVTYSGPTSGTLVTNIEGIYRIFGAGAGTYTITASIPDYTMNPDPASVVVTTNDKKQDFTATRLWNQWSGLVRDGNNVGVGNVSLTLSGTDALGNPVLQTVLSSSVDGSYLFDNLEDSNGSGYTVTPTYAGYTFNPVSSTKTVTTDKTQNFTMQCWRVSGTVTDAGTGNPIQGVAMSLTGPLNFNTTTALDGTYSFDRVPNGSYTLTPSHPNYVFTPNNFTMAGGNLTRNFTGTRTKYSISGSLKNGNTPLVGFTLNLTGAGTGSTTTDASGNWTFSNLNNSSTYTVTPASAGYDFDPASDTETIASNDITGVNFVSILQNMTVFVSNRDVNNEIYSMDASGNSQTNLTGNAADDHDPAYSVEHNWIVFTSNRFDGTNNDYEIYRMNGDGSGLTQLTTDGGTDMQPAWTGTSALPPFTDKILFVSNRSGRFEIWKMDTNGGNQVQVTNTAVVGALYNQYPSVANVPSLGGWSLFFSSDRQDPGGDEDICYIPNITGQPLPFGDASVVAMMNTPAANDSEPRVAPSGQYLAYSRDGEVYRYRFSDSTTINLTNNAAWDNSPTWSAYSNTILFVSDRVGSALQIFGMRTVSGVVLKQYTSSGENWWPSRRGP
ncbi:MAG: carboxypeptidase regulatory-like domain-containing protein [Armatimonadetes bacterium]|nr:carboxypeptidase regulatory-like domain-containing protein [Armatimonadota bacterium]